VKQFNYKAKDKNNRRVKGSIEALNRNAALADLKGRKFRDIKVAEALAPKKITKPFVWGPFGKVTDEEIVLFTKKVSTMVRSGLSILDALTLVSSQTQNPVFKYAIEDIIANINQGNSLSVSIRQQPKYFDEVFCNMIEAGEISGKLDSFLDRIVEGQERMQTIRKGIKSALFYPVTLVVVTLLITYGMLTKVVPTFTEMYKGMGKKLPGPTQVIVDASDWILNGWNVLSIIGVVIAIKVIHNQLFKRVYNYKKMIIAVGLLNAVVAAYIFLLVPEYLLRFLAWMLSNVVYRFRVRGGEHIPVQGAALLVCNHVSFVDAILLMAASPRPIRFIMDHQIFAIPVLGRVFRLARAIPIAPQKEDPATYAAAFDAARAVLDEGDLLAIFPEGAITRDGTLGEFRGGVAKILATHPVPVVPMALTNLWGSFFSRIERGRAMVRPFRRGPFSVVGLEVGEPMAAVHASPERLRERVAARLGADPPRAAAAWSAR
jgi:1-acyl-sn-glycerol-3-phosphate acyltransferase